MKKRLLVFIIIFVIIILLFPIRRETNDGGTVEYSAVLYKVIKWNRMREYEENKTGTEIYFFPKNLHSLEYYDSPRPESIAIYSDDKYVVANIGTYQWSKKVDGITLYVNACSLSAIDMEYKENLKIVAGSNVKTFLSNDVTEIKIYKYNNDKFEILDETLEYNQETQEINVDKLAPGSYIIELVVEDGNNKVRYSFKIEIVDNEE